MQPVTQFHFWSVIVQLLNLALIGLGGYVVLLLCKALQKYLRSTANLFSLAELFGVKAEKLPENVHKS